MTDTLHLFSEVDFESNQELLEKIFSQFEEGTWTGISKNTGTKFFGGKIRNLRIKLNNNSISIQGSLAKFYFGNNLCTLSYDQTIDAIIELEACLGLSLEDAIVRRIDLACNLIMENVPCSYYVFLAKGGFLKRREDDNGLYYRNNNRAILLYDKVQEQKTGKNQLVAHVKKLNLLRYEFRLKRSGEIAHRLNLQKPTLKSVITNYDNLVELWRKSFDLIYKDIEFEIPEEDVFKTPTKFKNYLALQGIKRCGGFSSVINMIHEAKARRIFSHANHGTNLKSCVKGLVNKVGISKTPEMILELQAKINASAQYAVESFLQY